MEIKKEVKVSMLSTDNKEINVGDTVVFVVNDKCHFGTFKGFGDRSVLIFEGLGCEYKVMPKTIKSIYLADIDIKEDKESEDK